MSVSAPSAPAYAPPVLMARAIALHGAVRSGECALRFSSALWSAFAPPTHLCCATSPQEAYGLFR